jgi:hypothetical protein
MKYYQQYIDANTRHYQLHLVPEVDVGKFEDSPYEEKLHRKSRCKEL